MDTRLGVVPSSLLGWQVQPDTHSTAAVPMSRKLLKWDSSSWVRCCGRRGRVALLTPGSVSTSISAQDPAAAAAAALCVSIL